MKFLLRLFKRATHLHWWDSLDVRPRTMDEVIANLHGDFVKCRRCGKETWISRQEYIKNLITTKRMGT